jgi:hypothetical protein
MFAALLCYASTAWYRPRGYAETLGRTDMTVYISLSLFLRLAELVRAITSTVYAHPARWRGRSARSGNND